jgi:hypothetical protein
MKHPQLYGIHRYFVQLLCNIFMTDAVSFASMTFTSSLGYMSLPESRFRLQNVLGFVCVLIYTHFLRNNVSVVTLNQVVNLTSSLIPYQELCMLCWT